VFDFEAMMKAIVVLGTAGLTFILLGIGVKLVFFRRRQLPGTVDPDQLDGVEDRLLRTEAKVTELEERLDFAERLLTEARNKAQLPGRP
jgi:hypothetical protein